MPFREPRRRLAPQSRGSLYLFLFYKERESPSGPFLWRYAPPAGLAGERGCIRHVLLRATHLAALTIVGDHITAMPTRDYQFRVSSRCELLPYLMSLPIGLS